MFEVEIFTFMIILLMIAGLSVNVLYSSKKKMTLFFSSICLLVSLILAHNLFKKSIGYPSRDIPTTEFVVLKVYNISEHMAILSGLKKDEYVIYTFFYKMTDEERKQLSKAQKEKTDGSVIVFKKIEKGLKRKNFTDDKTFKIRDFQETIKKD